MRALYENERESARDRAVARVLGPVPEIHQFKTTSVSQFPQWVIVSVYLLSLIVLIAGFVPSSSRIYLAGMNEFCKTLPDAQSVSQTGPEGSQFSSAASSPVYQDSRCHLVGIASVFLAETGQLVFLLGLAVVDRTSRPSTQFLGRQISVSLTVLILWSGTFLSTLVAIVGNIHVSQPWLHGNWIFAYVETFVPPIIVMGVGYVLKELLLHSIKQRHAATAAYEKALQLREQLSKNPESSPDWNRIYTLALKDTLRQTNKRRPEVNSLSRDQWAELIRHEMRESRLIVTPETVLSSDTVDDIQAAEKSLEPVWQIPAGTWAARSPITGNVIGEEYRTRGYAENAIRSHVRASQKRVAQNGHL